MEPVITECTATNGGWHAFAGIWLRAAMVGCASEEGFNWLGGDWLVIGLFRVGILLLLFVQFQ